MVSKLVRELKYFLINDHDKGWSGQLAVITEDWVHKVDEVLRKQTFFSAITDIKSCSGVIKCS